MKRLYTLLLCLSLCLSLFSACGEKETEPYTPTGNGLTREEDPVSPVSPVQEEDPQKLTLIWYPEKA